MHCNVIQNHLVAPVSGQGSPRNGLCLLGWETGRTAGFLNRTCGCPTLATSLFLSLGWDSTNPTHLFQLSTRMGAPHLDFEMWGSTNPNPPGSSHRTSFPVGAMLSSSGPANKCARASTLRASPVSAISAASRSGTQRRSPAATVIPSISSSNTVRIRT